MSGKSGKFGDVISQICANCGNLLALEYFGTDRCHNSQPRNSVCDICLACPIDTVLTRKSKPRKIPLTITLSRYCAYCGHEKVLADFDQHSGNPFKCQKCHNAGENKISSVLKDIRKTRQTVIHRYCDFCNSLKKIHQFGTGCNYYVCRKCQEIRNSPDYPNNCNVLADLAS